MKKTIEELIGIVLESGADKALVIPVSDIVTDRSFRTLCESNACGNFGKNWMCPPLAGDIDDLIKELRIYRFALVYQMIGMLEDSYDFEGMSDAVKEFSKLQIRIRNLVGESDAAKFQALYLGAGGCSVCDVCAKRMDETCRHPELANASLETYGVNVYELAKLAGMKYINGQNTVTYFGAVLFK